MVRIWDRDVEKGIALTKMRIKHCEKHGMGDTVIREKNILKKQERHQQVRDEAK